MKQCLNRFISGPTRSGLGPAWRAAKSQTLQLY